jgi:hypothetical protein
MVAGNFFGLSSVLQGNTSTRAKASPLGGEVHGGVMDTSWMARGNCARAAIHVLSQRRCGKQPSAPVRRVRSRSAASSTLENASITAFGRHLGAPASAHPQEAQADLRPARDRSSDEDADRARGFLLHLGRGSRTFGDPLARVTHTVRHRRRRWVGHGPATAPRRPVVHCPRR